MVDQRGSRLGLGKLPASYAPSTQLPDMYKNHLRQMRAHERQNVPKWFTNQQVCERVARVWGAYLAHTPIPQIMAREGISYQQVWIDIRHAREERRIRFALELEEPAMLAIERRYQDISDIQRHIRRLVRRGKPGPQQAQAIAKFFSEIEKNRQAIEELEYLRGGIAVRKQTGSESSDIAPVTLVINMDSGSPVQVIEAAHSVVGRNGDAPDDAVDWESEVG